MSEAKPWEDVSESAETQALKAKRAKIMALRGPSPPAKKKEGPIGLTDAFGKAQQFEKRQKAVAKVTEGPAKLFQKLKLGK